MDVFLIMLRKRSIIENINDMLKNVAHIVHTRYRSVSYFIVNLLDGMVAYAFYDTKLSINMEFEMEEEAEVSCSHFSKIYLRETMKLQSTTRSKDS